ncbi:hypothetical protein [Agrobacterium fabrum]|uniref:hypothetical protein n=1 Tax=Agrobacterium fabrum TaxID=1176649 RepID=UPI001EC94DFE|nr:hypothetical protein [Agrobacterium fabrum]
MYRLEENGIQENLYWLEKSYGTNFELDKIAGKIADEAAAPKVLGFAVGAMTAIGASVP